MWLFHLHSTVGIQPFSPVFPLAESKVRVFCRLFLWSFKEKTSTVFYGTAFEERFHLPSQFPSSPSPHTTPKKLPHPPHPDGKGNAGGQQARSHPEQGTDFVGEQKSPQARMTRTIPVR